MEEGGGSKTLFPFVSLHAAILAPTPKPLHMAPASVSRFSKVKNKASIILLPIS